MVFWRRFDGLKNREFRLSKREGSVERTHGRITSGADLNIFSFYYPKAVWVLVPALGPVFTFFALRASSEDSGFSRRIEETY